MSGAPPTSADSPHRTRREAIVQSLISDIVQGRFVAGQHLVTQELAQRFSVSHTPIREALIALGGIGLLTLQPHRGAVVRQISPREVREVCRVRRAMECEAVRGACGRIDPVELRRLRRSLQQLVGRRNAKGVAQARVLDSQLHDLVIRSAGNQFLANELNRLKLLFRAFRDVAWEHDTAQNGFERLTEETQEHLEIIDALLAVRRGEAMRSMSRHICSGMRYWSRALPSAAESRRAPAAHLANLSLAQPDIEVTP